MTVDWKRFFSTLGWAIKHIYCAGKKTLLVLLLLMSIQGIIPVCYLYILKSITERLGSTIILSQIILLLAIWCVFISFETLLPPLVQLLRTKVNERIHSIFNLILLNKANSFTGLELLENKCFNNEIVVLQEESKNKPLNLMYILTDSFKEIISIFLIFSLLATISLWLCLVLFLSLIPQVAFVFISEKKIWDYSLFESEDMRKVGKICSLGLNQSAAKEIRTFRFGDYLTKKFQALAHSFQKKLGAKRKRAVLSINSLFYFFCFGTVSCYCLDYFFFKRKSTFFA